MRRLPILFLVLIFFSTGISCSKSFLDEETKSFFSTDNAFKTEKDFEASVNNLYALVRAEFYTVNDFMPFQYIYRTDVAFEITVTTPNLSAEIAPTGFPGSHWTALYKIVAEANTILGRLPASEVSEAAQVQFEAKAKFFRGFAYRSLAYLFGGVPLVLEEITGEKTDFVRASKKEVLTQVIDDLTFAAANLPGITAVKDGEISNLAAQHLLSEVYLADGQYQEAVTAATAVIDDPNTDLMKARFGASVSVPGKDVYWDLFQPKNQNRKTAGNTEGIWVIQIETDVQGGSGSTSGGSQSGVYSLERVHAPFVRDLRINGVSVFRWPVGDYTGGRGVGFLAPSLYFMDTVWQSDFNNDIRNANHNFVRDFVANNPGSPLFGQVISTKNPPAGVTVPSRVFYPYQSKATTPFNHPASLYANAATFELKSTAGGTYRDEYLFRLAETYLLRAEAYLGLGNTGDAAKDINVVRTRAQANPVLPGNVNIDYILDERMREFGVEEKRMLTLMRLGKFYDRVKQHNPFYGIQMQPHYNLWPIPQPEIERNRGAVLEQNPGYQ